MQGKSFTVESGTVTFVGADPTNPEIVVKASWPAPDGTTVYASFIGAVTAKVDTSQSTNPRPEVEIQIARDISLQLAVVLGQPSPGVNPDHTLLTLDWRFLSRWSLATTLGDAGTTIFDLLWQRRY